MKHLAVGVFVIAAFGAALAFGQEHAAPAAGGAHTAPSTAIEKGQEHAAQAVQHGEGHEAQPMPNEIWWKWANFAVLALGLGFLIGKNAGPFFRARTTAIQSDIAQSAAVRAEAEARASQIEQRIANLSTEVEALRQTSRQEIGREGDRVKAETAALSAKLQKQAEAEIAAAVKNASQELKAYSAELAIGLAKQQIRDRMTPDAQNALTDAFVKDLGRKGSLN